MTRLQHFKVNPVLKINTFHNSLDLSRGGNERLGPGWMSWINKVYLSRQTKVNCTADWIIIGLQLYILLKSYCEEHESFEFLIYNRKIKDVKKLCQ